MKLLKPSPNLSFIVALFFTVAVSVANAAGPIPAAPKVAAKNYILVDADSGHVLAEKEADQQVEPASITKMMTAYVIYRELEADRLSMDDMVTISEKAWRMGGSRMYVEVDSQVSVHDLMKGLIVQSGNDATVALAEHVAGSERAFVDLMNQYAATLGMNNTHYLNSTGWPEEGHLTSARDIATLALAIINEFPEHYAWYKEKLYTYNNIKQYNRNKLLWRDDSVDGIKTGHTESAGYCLVASALRADMRLISVALGADSEKSRASVSQSLLNYGFRFFETHKLYSAGEILNRSRVWKGESDKVSLGLLQDLYITIPRGSYNELEAVMDVDASIVAPLEKGSQHGAVRVNLADEEMLNAPLVALEPVAEGSIFQIAKDHILQLFN
ncbi:MAG: D-alanyl-D-alanine carboxypeptidase [Gammaproteobacteria bacterium]|nr:D-alanyl-D-alanine carboxypeptidase [Gammaproteobacteria bacterium]NNJ97279.1 D-alanyl-D-alanine carboxypeptidase [Gammaproteobacteria bacterium]